MKIKHSALCQSEKLVSFYTLGFIQRTLCFIMKANRTKAHSVFVETKHSEKKELKI